MSDPLFDADDDANTPITPEEREGLIPTYITTRRELNEAEQININDGDRWAFARRGRDVLDEAYLRRLHKEMLGKVWRWAGMLFVLWLKQSRLRNDGVPATLIEVLERRLVTANEAEVIKTLRHSTRNADPAFSASALGAIALAITK